MSRVEDLVLVFMEVASSICDRPDMVMNDDELRRVMTEFVDFIDISSDELNSSINRSCRYVRILSEKGHKTNTLPFGVFIVIFMMAVERIRKDVYDDYVGKISESSWPSFCSLKTTFYDIVHSA